MLISFSRMESGSIYTCFWLLSRIPVFPLMSKLYILNRCARLFFSGHMGCSRTKLAINEPVHPCRQYRHFYGWLHFRAGAFQYLSLLVQVLLVPLAADRALNFQANYLGQIHSSHLPWAESKRVLQSMWGLVLGPPSIKAHKCFNPLGKWRTICHI